MKTNPISGVLLCLSSSCISIENSATYTPPNDISEADRQSWTRTIEKPFDAVWSALVDHTSDTFFAIENFEKESGLMTLSFGASGIAEFVDGGHWAYQQRMKNAPTAQLRANSEVDFDGNYADFLEKHQAATLTGKMNLFVKQLDPEHTEVKVRARYIVATNVVSLGGRAVNNTWAFDTGGSSTIEVSNPVQGLDAHRTLQPTHKAEQSIINAIERISAE